MDPLSINTRPKLSGVLLPFLLIFSVSCLVARGLNKSLNNQFSINQWLIAEWARVRLWLRFSWVFSTPGNALIMVQGSTESLLNYSLCCWFTLPGVTERTTTGFSLPATKPKPSTGSRLISTFRGAGGTNLSPSRRISSRELLWEMWLWNCQDKLSLVVDVRVGFMTGYRNISVWLKILEILSHQTL